MTDIASIHALPVAMTPAPTVAADSRVMGIEFDALLLETLIKSSGLLNVFDSEEGGSSMMLGDMLAYPLARQLAEQVDLGFGKLAFRTSESTAIEGGK